MKKLFVAASLSLALIASQSALAMPPKPERCPGVESLKSSKFELVQQDKDGTWVTGVLHNNYDTNDAWTFVMAKITANSENAAMKKANKALKSLAFQTGPIAIEQYGLWACAYNTADGFPAVSVTPALGLRAASLLK